MDKATKKKVLSIIKNADDEAESARNEFERGKAFGESHGIFRALRAMGFDVIYYDDGSVDIEAI